MGVLELHPNGYGFLRNPKTNFLRERTDPFVPGTMIDKYRLREGVLDQRHGPAQQEAARTAAERNHRRRRDEARRVRQRQGLRRAHAHQSRKAGSSWKPARPAVDPRHGSADAARQGAAGPDRGAAAHRQDLPAAAHQSGHFHQLSRDHADRAARRRAARRSDRHAPQRARRRHRQQPRPRRGKPRPAIATRRRTLQAAGRDGQRRFLAHGLHHPHGPGLQQMGRQHRPHHVGRRRYQGAGHSRRNCSPRPACSKKGAR